jgi:hypothetical protein
MMCTSRILDYLTKINIEKLIKDSDRVVPSTLTANCFVSMFSFITFLKPYGASHPSQGFASL